MRTTLITILLAVVSLAGDAQVKNDLTEEGIKGRVKTITETVYACDVVVNKGQPAPLAVISKGAMTHRNVKEYNQKGDCTENTAYLSTGEPFSIETIKEQGNTRIRKSEAGSEVSVYDKLGNRMSVTAYDKEGKVKNTTTYRYDERNNLTERKQSNEVYRISYEYDKKGTTLEKREYDAAGVVLLKTVYERDKNGNENGYISWWADGKVASKSVREFDVHGKELRRIETSEIPDRKAIVIYSNYDVHGNWQELVVAPDGHESYVLERVIEYYK